MFTSSGSGDSLLSVGFEEPQLGSNTSEIMSRIIEVAISIVTALASTGILSRFKWFSTIVDILKPFVSPKEAEMTPEEQKLEDSFRMLRSAIADKDRNLTILMIVRLAGEDYLNLPVLPKTRPLVPVPKPEKEEDA